MNTQNKTINQIINSLMELEAKGFHTVFFEYGNGLFRIRIFKGEVNVENIVFERTFDTKDEQSEPDEIYRHVNNMKYCVRKTSFKCLKRKFIKGEKAGKWETVKPSFEFGENAMQAMLIDGSGYYVDDPDNGLQYFVDYKNISETGQ
jgi:hypothetical protein